MFLEICCAIASSTCCAGSRQRAASNRHALNELTDGKAKGFAQRCEWKIKRERRREGGSRPKRRAPIQADPRTGAQTFLAYRARPIRDVNPTTPRGANLGLSTPNGANQVLPTPNRDLPTPNGSNPGLAIPNGANRDLASPADASSRAGRRPSGRPERWLRHPCWLAANRSKASPRLCRPSSSTPATPRQ